MKELELFSLGGLSGWFGRNKHAFTPAPGQKCLNCETELAGRYCHVCAQDADTHHRTIGHLIFEAFEGLFHVDGRLWQTLPPLFFAPGKLGRDLMEGGVARHIPPFRIFLVALLVFMFVAEHKTEETRRENDAVHHAALAADGKDGGNYEGVTVIRRVDPKTGETTVTRNIRLFAISGEDARYLAKEIDQSHMQPKWLKDDLVRALNNPERFFTSVFTWGHRLALLLLPIVGLLLGMLYMGKKHRRFFLYDHLLVAMNLLSFIFFTLAAEFALPEAAKPFAAPVLFVWTMLTFFNTLRGGYGSSVFGAILKSLVLWVMTAFSFSLLLALVMFVSLAV
ncbi:MAG: DUF3667 domain-containing protein [Asticcacaulis sp.]|nr:DUF3667 domain-containing protein [Asticcacaulis sp.]